MLDNEIVEKSYGKIHGEVFPGCAVLCLCSIQMFTITGISFEIDVSLSNYQVDESSKHTEDDEHFTREDEIMCSALEEIS